MPENFSNRFQTTLTAGITSGALTGTVTSVTGVPTAPFRAIITLPDVNGAPAPPDATDEIVLVTSRSGTTLTWTRAAEAVAGVQAASAHGIGATFTAIVTAVQAARWETPLGEFNVRDYGAVGDGVTDDVASIQAAIDAAGAAGGGEIYFPPGTYKLIAFTTVTYTSAADSSYHLRVLNDRITFCGAGRSSIIQSADDVNPFHLYKTPTSTLNWEFAHCLISTVYPMASAVAGARSVTLSTPGHAANFAVGDYAFIRTGQTIAALVEEPDSEINQVVSADAGTGVVAFRWPLVKPYAQEYFISGTTGKTSTNVTANPALFGISNVTVHTLTDIAFRDLHFAGPLDVYALIGSGIVGFTMENCTGLFKNGPLSLNIVRHGRVANNRFEFSGTGANTWSVGIGYGTSDMVVADNVFTGEHTPFIHVHEGWASAVISGNLISSPTTATSSTEVAISIRARAYDIVISDNVIRCNVVAGVYVDMDCSGGGLIIGNVIQATTAMMSIESPNWMQRENVGTPARVEQIVTPLVPQVVEQLAGWVKWDNQTVALGTIPDNSIVIAVRVAQWTPFNGSGTDLISVGYAADHTKYAANVDVSGGYQLTTPPLTTFGWEPAAQDLVAYYTNGGTEPTAGTCCVMVDFVRIPNGSN